MDKPHLLLGVNVGHGRQSSTPPRSPIAMFCPPLSPGGLSQGSNHSGRRFFNPSPSRKVCTMDCIHCRKMARQIRDDGENFASAPVSRKSSGGDGKFRMAFSILWALLLLRGFSRLCFSEESLRVINRAPVKLCEVGLGF